MLLKPRLPSSCPLMHRVEVAARVLGRRIEYDPIANLLPPHRSQVCMALECLAYVVDAVPYRYRGQPTGTSVDWMKHPDLPI